ncbi:MAG: diaminopimelate epimerase [Ignavibacteria bacterium RBG_16_34_14]|nr:MAG: diaminopimelate epimerase [Ignavibacteria bacterium RBG_16_34_14]
MNNFSFVKMSGAGNDFIVFDRKNNPGLTLNSSIIKKLCDRRNGIGADGIITISDNGKHDFIMEYFNADGSTGSLCGNGSRCAIKFANLTGRTKDKNVNFVSNNKVYSGKIIDDKKIKFYLDEPADLELDFNIYAFQQSITVNYINTGSPHVVIDIKNILKNPEDLSSGFNDLDEVPVSEIGSEIRYLTEFAPEGTNVNFIKIDNNKVAIRTYERGVEDETYSCGTGSAASAIIASLAYGIEPPVTLLTKGGEELIVDFVRKENKIENLSLSGSAKIVFTGEISETVFHNYRSQNA